MLARTRRTPRDAAPRAPNWPHPRHAASHDRAGPLMPSPHAILWALPWILLALAAPWLFRARPRLRDTTPAEPTDQLVSIIVPARNEAINIGACIGSILGTRHPNIEILVIDDDSRDGTGEIARNLAERDSRIRLIHAEPLPDGWLGKCWACWQGFKAAKGQILVFTDADTRHEPELLPRAVAALRQQRADLVSIMPRQVTASFWERVVLPQVFLLMRMRYPDLRRINRSADPKDAIANGQFLLFNRASYEAIGGHEAVRNEVVEDLRLAQRIVAAGRRLHLAHAEEFMRTRMYRSLSDIIEGWSKNLAAGSRQSVDPWLRPVLPWLLGFVVAGWWLLPPLALLAGLSGNAGPTLHGWGALASLASLAFWIMASTAFRIPRIYALAFPLGAAVTAFLLFRSAFHGNRVRWKGRTYQLGEGPGENGGRARP